MSSLQRRKIKSLLKQMIFFFGIGALFVLVLMALIQTGRRSDLSGEDLFKLKGYLEDAAKITKYLKDSGRNRKLHAQRLESIVRNLELILEINVKQSRLRKFNETEPEFGELTSLCPEEFVGTLEGYPLYETGFTVQECDHHKRMQELVTIVVILADRSETKVKKLLSEIQQKYPGVRILAGLEEETPFQREELEQLNPMVEIEVFSEAEMERPGFVWSSLLQALRTPYAFICIDMESFGVDIDLERMVRASELLKANIVGTSVRRPDGKWNLNCYQTTYQNFTLYFEPGYDHSAQECLRCSHFEGPFLAKTEVFTHRIFDNYLQHFLTIDFHLRTPGRSKFRSSPVVCPDSMSHIKVLPSRPTSEMVLPLAKKLSVFHLHLPSGDAFKFSGDDLRVSCKQVNGMVLSPECIKELQDTLEFLFNSCALAKAMCQLQEGTLLGAVKLGTILPWEKDADITVLSDDFHLLLKQLDKNQGPGTLEIKEAPSCPDEADTCTGGQAIYATHSWTYELNGQSELQEHVDIKKSTLVNMGGYWFPTSRNPGRHARNRYGPELYQHVEHWMTLGKHDGWQLYNPSPTFTQCPYVDGHACLDQFKTDGNMQFKRHPGD